MIDHTIKKKNFKKQANNLLLIDTLQSFYLVLNDDALYIMNYRSIS